jgi:hypothetical protein
MMQRAQESPKKKTGFFGWIKRILVLAILAAAAFGGWSLYEWYREREVLRQIVARLTAEEKVAEVWVEDYRKAPDGRMEKLRLKVMEYGRDGKPLPPVFCEFTTNDVVHFEALVIRLDDAIVMDGRGKSVHLFRRAFALDDSGNTYQSCDITRPMAVPGGYRLEGAGPREREIEERYWKKFWELALDEGARRSAGVKNAQIEAPATRFVPGRLYRLSLEADGGLTIQPGTVPQILQGEKVPESGAAPATR